MSGTGRRLRTWDLASLAFGFWLWLWVGGGGEKVHEEYLKARLYDLVLGTKVCDEQVWGLLSLWRESLPRRHWVRGEIRKWHEPTAFNSGSWLGLSLILGYACSTWCCTARDAWLESRFTGKGQWEIILSFAAPEKIKYRKNRTRELRFLSGGKYCNLHIPIQGHTEWEMKHVTGFSHTASSDLSQLKGDGSYVALLVIFIFIFDTLNRNRVSMNKLPYTDEPPPLLGPTSWLPSVFTHPTLTIVQKWTYWRTGSLPRASIVKTRGEAPVNVESRGILIELIRPGVYVNFIARWYQRAPLKFRVLRLGNRWSYPWENGGNGSWKPIELNAWWSCSVPSPVTGWNLQEIWI